MCDLPMSVEQGDFLARAMTAACEGRDHEAADLLRQLANTTTREGQ